MNKTTIQNIVSKLIQLEESKIVDQANALINNKLNHGLTLRVGYDPEVFVTAGKKLQQKAYEIDNPEHRQELLRHANLLQSFDRKDHIESANTLRHLPDELAKHVIDSLKTIKNTPQGREAYNRYNISAIWT